ncbi:amino acid adenylation domain-containing protein [Pseudoalteromonas sp. T1lg65]|uniref:amino acid adenylation domain-containing protein n=1 Tax=Pseudoalteromonas sp. T1lg65 TaxID=2077101 RepID=UPI003F7B184C
MKTDLVSILISHAQTRGDSTVYQYFFDEKLPSKTLTFAQLDRHARIIAHKLSESFQQGDRALLLYNSGFEFVEAFFACLYAGIIAVPIYPPKKNQNTDRLRAIIQDAGAKGALTTAKINEIARPLFEAEETLQNVAIFETDVIADQGHESLAWDDIHIEPESLAFLQYTSGSTGNPKGVMVSHANIMDNEEMMKVAFGHAEGSQIVSWLPHFHDMGLIFGILHPVYLGGQAALMNPTYFLQKPYRWLKLLSDTKATTSSAPNFAYDLCVDTIKDEELATLDLSHWRSALNGAEPVRASTLERFYQKFKACGLNRKSISPCYGMAETTLFATGGALSDTTSVLRLDPIAMQKGLAIPVDDFDSDSFFALDLADAEQPYYAVSSGKTWHGHTIAVVNPDNLQRCDDDQVGEIWVKGASVAKGYWAREEATAQTFQAFIADENDGPYLRTGDLGFLHNQHVYVTGRCKDVMIFRGKNYYPQDIELTAYEAHDAMDNNGGAAFAVTINGEERLVLVQQVKRTSVRKLNADEVFSQVTQAIVGQYGIVPHEILLIKPGRILKTSSGKIQRQENKRWYLENKFDVLARSIPVTMAESKLGSLSKHQHSKLIELLQQTIAQEIDKPADSLDVDASFLSLGVDSMKAVRIAGELMELHELDLEPTVLYEHPSISQLAQHLSQFESVQMLLGKAAPSSSSDELAANPAVSLKDDEKQGIAIIGMACRYPQASNLEQYWQLLLSKGDGIASPSSTRLNLGPLDPNRLGGYLDDIEMFDEAVFAISPSEAKHLDPQHRLLLQTSFHAIQNAGYMPDALAGSDIGVYVGISQNDYFLLSQQTEPSNAYLGTGTALSVAANRISYTFNFTGPSVAVDTACSSSLVALHQARLALNSGEISQALVAGVNLILTDDVSAACEKAQMLAADGHCKTFSNAADGYVRSEGVGVVLLKPLSQAIQDNDHIYGVLKGSATNQDGRSNGITAPNGGAQQKVIRAALDNAALPAHAVQYVETHGTGTELGDPIEVSALAKVYGEGRVAEQPLLLGAAKANIGHLESGAGIAGLIKACLCLHHQRIPAQRYSESLNSHIPWHKLPVSVVKEETPWLPQNGAAKVAAISSFGFGGTNAHVICTQAPTRRSEQIDIHQQVGIYVLPLSAKSESALKTLARQYHQQLTEASPIQFDALVCQTALQPAMKGLRTSFAGSSRAALLDALQSSELQLPQSARKNGKVVMLFTGQGAQYFSMGRALYESQPVFRAAIDECDSLLYEHLNASLVAVLYQDRSQSMLQQTQWTQVCLFAIEYAQAKLWLSLGIEPEILVSHSVGEYAAACIADVFSLSDALKLLAARGLLMAELATQGAMMSARLSETEAQQWINPYRDKVVISGFHGEAGVIFSGEPQALSDLSTQLTAKQIEHRTLHTACAFHSPQMTPMLDAFSKVAQQIEFHPPRIAFISSRTGKLADVELATADYWVQQIIEPVRFGWVINTLQTTSDSFCALELGPKPVLSALIQANNTRTEDRFTHVLNHQGDDLQRFAEACGCLFEYGVTPDWKMLYGEPSFIKVPLPAYPFDKHPHWITGATAEVETIARQSSVAVDRDDAIRQYVLNTLARLLSTPVSAIETDLPLLEMGVDSLMIMQAVRIYEKEFGLEFSVRQFYEELKTVDKLVEYIQVHSNYQSVDASISELKPPKQPEENQLGADGTPLHSTLLAICQAQLDAALQVSSSHAQQSVQAVTAQQLQLFNQLDKGLQLPVARSTPVAKVAQLASPVNTASSLLPGFQVKQTQASQVQNSRYLSELSEQYCHKTAKSKQLVAEHRAHLADCRASAGFRLSTKELLYPVFSKRCEGASVWDIDGNEYIDITMDFGVNLFGHKPEFVHQALQQQLDAGLQLGLASPLACEVAELVCELTGLQRASFCNSGTEAVMTAIRLARTVTKRDKIVQFTGAYHGHYDGTLASLSPLDEGVEPMCSGVRQGAVSDNLVLTYGDSDSLETIRQHGADIAAVIVEPVQSRHPELQPWAFLRELRALTESLGIALIFDEMITGFRAHPGGVQGMLGIQADLATYGKIVGGGLPIGVVAGSAQFMDALDGGQWQYGDDSYPQVDTTFFAGTFCKHPLVMASAKAVLSEIKRQGPELQQAISDKTTYLKDTLNQFFSTQAIPIRIEAFASLFRFTFSQNLDVFFYEMLNRGVFIWEGRNCFLSAAHTDADVEAVIQAVKDSALSLQAAGYFGEIKLSPVALSTSQQQLLALALRNDEGAFAYQLQVAVKLVGELDVDRLQQAVQQVAQYQPLITTGVDIEQLCLRPASGQVCFTINAAAQDELGVVEQLIALRYQQFDFNHDSLCRFALLSDDNQGHYFSIVAHHVLFDGMSLQQLLAAVANAYNQPVGAGVQAKVQFQDYLAGLQRYQQSAQFAEDVEYWQRRLAANTALTLPSKVAEQHNTSLHVEQLVATLSLPQINKISALSKAVGVGNYATMLSIYLLWLHKLSQQSVVSVGCPVSDRQILATDFDPEILDRELLGYCTNILPILVDFSQIEDLSGLLKMVQSQLLDGFEHQHYPFAELTHSELVMPTCLFNLDKVNELPQLNGLSLEPVNSPTQYGQFELSCNVVALQSQWKIELEFNCDKFDRELADNYLQALLGLFEQLDATTRIDSKACALVSQTHLRNALYDPFAEAESKGVDNSFIELFQDQLNTYAEAPAVIFDEQQLSYQELNYRANRLARYLQRNHQIGEGSLVAIALPRRIELLVALLAIHKCGAAFLPLDLTFPSERLEYILTDADVALVLVDEQSVDAPLMQSHQFVYVDIDDQAQAIREQSDTDLALTVKSQQLAYVIYTSGSTGTPKGVEISQGALVNLLTAMQQSPGIRSVDTLLCVTTIAFDIALLELFAPLLAGAKVVLASEAACSDTSAMVELIKSQKVTIMQATPTLWRLLMATDPQCVEGVTVLCGGEPLEPALAGALLKHADALWNMYGPTETTIWSSIAKITAPQNISIGQAIAKTALYVMPENSKDFDLPLPDGVWGELWIAGQGLAKGYLNKPELTQQRFITHRFDQQHRQRVYKTGDKARRLPNGHFEVIGRFDQQVKLHGHRIELQDINVHLQQVLKVDTVRTLVKPVADQGLALCAYCVDDGKLSQQFTLAAIRQVLQTKLPSYMLPEYLCWLPAWPTTANGKLDVNALPEPQVTQSSNERGRQAQTQTELQISVLMLELLPINVMRAEQSFFDVGGNSVLAMQLVSRLNKSFAVKLTVADIFDYPTIASLADRIDSLLQARAASGQQREVELTKISQISSGRDISDALGDESMTEMDL